MLSRCLLVEGLVSGICSIISVISPLDLKLVSVGRSMFMDGKRRMNH